MIVVTAASLIGAQLIRGIIAQEIHIGTLKDPTMVIAWRPQILQT
jgi:hypothetical protein